MIEVEVRAKIKDKDKIIKNILDIGAKFLGTKIQRDWIFGNPQSLNFKLLELF